jgi:hypothetical protein
MKVMIGKKYSAIEKIGDLTGLEVGEVRDNSYKPCTFSRPSIYTVGDDYYAACDIKPKHHVGKEWELRKTFRGHNVWVSKMLLT